MTTHLHLAPRSRMSRSYISSLPSTFIACSGTALAFYCAEFMYRAASFASDRMLLRRVLWQNLAIYSQARFTTTIFYHTQHVLYAISFIIKCLSLTTSMHDVRETDRKSLFPQRRDKIFLWYWQWWRWYNIFSVFRIHFKTNHAQFEVSLFSTYMHGRACKVFYMTHWKLSRETEVLVGGDSTHHENWEHVPFGINIRSIKRKW
jgi:hypothetical protein